VRRFRTNGLQRVADNGMPDEPRVDQAAGWRRPPLRDSPWATLEREIDRSRRHRHTLALLRLSWPASDRAQRRKLSAGVDALRATVRSVDSVWVDHDGILVLLPESDRAGADGLLARVRATSPGLVDAGEVRVASFPQDGLTANALRAAVRRARPIPTALPVGPARAAASGADREAAAERGRAGLRRHRRSRP
jgi:hypothetical protein